MPYAPADRMASRSPSPIASSRPRPSQSPDSQTGPTMSYSWAAAVVGSTVTMSCQASYIAGRIRSFIAASTTAKRLSPLALSTSTRVSSTPALPTIARPNSNSVSGTSRPRAAAQASMRANIARSISPRAGGVSSR